MMNHKIIPYTLLASVVLLGSHSLHAQSALPVCQSALSDSDGDGFGWENAASCRVANGGTSTPANNNGNSNDRRLPTCLNATSDPDGDGFGWENSTSCRVGVVAGPTPPPSTTPPGTTPSSNKPTCVSANSDPDGDGYGWENSRSCVVAAGTSTPTPTPTPTNTLKPICTSANSDPDGDGFGWENNTSCIVADNEPQTGTDEFRAVSPAGVLTSGTPAFQWNALADAEMYTLAISDSRGNGYSYEIDPMRAGCQTGNGTCTATPDLAYYDNDLTWRVKSTVNGSDGPETNRLAISTPRNINIQPVKSGQCEAWPSVAYDKYVVLNNSWNSRSMNNNGWEQKIFVNEDNFGNVRPSWNYNWLGQYDGDEIEVKSYPEVLYGPKLGTHVSGTKAETGLPELVGSLPEFTVDYSYSETGNAERNVALESFFHDSCNITGPCDPIDNRAYEMMIWVENPSIRTPGDLALTGVMIDNRLWNVYIKPRSNKHYIAFTAQDSQPTGTLHWNRFVDWTRNWTAENAERLSIDVLSPEFCMGAIELGTETWWGEGTFTLNKFDVSFVP